MDKRFFNLYNLTEQEAIAVLDSPKDQTDEGNSRYTAAAHLVNFPTNSSINALIRAVENTDSSLDNRIVRRKAVETLGRLQAKQALSVIRKCLGDEDCYTVENAVWAIGELGIQEEEILEEVAQVLEKPGQLYRTIIHILAKLNYQPALSRLRHFVDHEDPPIASAAISAICRLSGDDTEMGKLVEFLQHSSVNARRGCIQDLIDCQYHPAIPEISRCPVSLIFRLRAIRLIGYSGIAKGILTFEQIQPDLEQVLRDHPNDLNLVHEYDQTPTLAFAIAELYQTDFGRCYLAIKTLLETYQDETPQALLDTYEEEAHNDYGAHYHVMKLFGWLKYAPAYDLLMSALQNPLPQFQKSRAAAAIALGEIGDKQAIPALKASLETNIWDLKYAALMALEKLGDYSCHAAIANDNDPLIAAKASRIALR